MKKYIRPSVVAVGALVASVACGLEYTVCQPLDGLKPTWHDKDTAPGVWTLNVDSALARAKTAGAHTILAVTGAWWCPYCQVCDELVFTTKEWKDYVAEKGFYLAMMDFPYRDDVPAGREEESWRPDLGKGWGFKCWLMNPDYLAEIGLTQEEGLDVIMDFYRRQDALASPAAEKITMKDWRQAEEFTYGKVGYLTLFVIGPDGENVGSLSFPWEKTESVTASEACAFVIQSLEQIMAGPVGPTAGVPTRVASTYDGFLVDEKWNAQGTIQVKVSKSNAKTGLASVKATVLLADGTKKNLKIGKSGKVKIAADGPTTVELSGGEACVLTLDADGFAGSYGAHIAEGARNYFVSNDRDERSVAEAAMGKWLGPVNVSWDGGSLGVTLAKKGKAKVKGTLADGRTKVAANTQFLFAETWSCVPVVVSKARLAFTLWLLSDGHTANVEGIPGEVFAGRPGTLASGAAFHVSTDAADWSAIPGKVLTDYLPDGVKVMQNGSKWAVFGKAGKVVYKDGVVDKSKLGDNPAGLKLTLKAEDGSFTGAFKVYAEINGRPKGITVNVTGYLVNGIGRGTATVRGKFSVPVTIQ